jgi:hypothetical protein
MGMWLATFHFALLFHIGFAFDQFAFALEFEFAMTILLPFIARCLVCFNLSLALLFAVTVVIFTLHYSADNSLLSSILQPPNSLMLHSESCFASNSLY